jgi:hypothetical protein
MKNKPKLLISICVALLLLATVLLVNSIQEYTDADVVAQYYIERQCKIGNPNVYENDEIGERLSFFEKIECQMEKIGEKQRFQSQLESQASENILFGLILFLASIYGLYYLNYKYEKGEKNEI